MKISVLGSGCFKCVALESTIGEVISELGRTDVLLERVSDERAIRRYVAADATPALVIDGRLVCSRTIPPKDVLWSWLATRDPQKGQGVEPC